ncbi:MAG: hypothetical protein LH603_21965, partial [Pseudonocardia sp.]|nr:hypothetical protein [Pseudonocardia sp.]
MQIEPLGEVNPDRSNPSVNSGPVARRWYNDEDLLTATLVKSFKDGKVEIAEGELAYGVAYDVSIFDVDGYQPETLNDRLVAGQVTSRSYTIRKELKSPLRILSTTAESCAPPPVANVWGAEIKIVF